MSPSAEHEAASANLRKAGEAWSPDEDDELVDQVREGLELEEIAEIHGRTIGAIRSRLKRMVPDDDQRTLSGQAKIGFLREQLAAGQYDWHTPLHAGRSKSAWTAEDDQRLRDGWDKRVPLDELADDLRRSETMLVRRLVELRIATDFKAVVDRLGCQPDGALATRVLIAEGALGPIVHVLLGTDDSGYPVHVSLHESAEAAGDMSSALADLDAGYGVSKWETIPRQVGGEGYADPSIGLRLKRHPPSGLTQ